MWYPIIMDCETTNVAQCNYELLKIQALPAQTSLRRRRAAPRARVLRSASTFASCHLTHISTCLLKLKEFPAPPQQTRNNTITNVITLKLLYRLPAQRLLPTQFNTLFFLQTRRNIQCRRKMSWTHLLCDSLLTVQCNKIHIQETRKSFVLNFLSSFSLHLAAIIHVILAIRDLYSQTEYFRNNS